MRAALAGPAAGVLACCGGAVGVVAEKRDAHSLLTRLALADVDHLGPFVELGSIARDRHTLGDWRTGWGPMVTRDGERWGTVVASSALVFVEPPAGDAPAELRVAVAPLAARRIAIHLGGEVLLERALDEGAQMVRVSIPPAAFATRPFAIDLRHDGAPGAPALAVRSVHLARGEGSAPPLLAELSDGDALTLRAPTRLSFPLEAGAGTRLEAFVSGRGRYAIWHRGLGD
ncbi:MAG: hypothetical protein KC619_31040, partial [Myxococcales bacterium]|nr:hypothetical protein [Myxococcales bacterium]